MLSLLPVAHDDCKNTRHLAIPAQELRERGGGTEHVPNSPYGLCGRTATLDLKLRSCVTEEVDQASVAEGSQGLRGCKATLKEEKERSSLYRNITVVFVDVMCH